MSRIYTWHLYKLLSTIYSSLTENFALNNDGR